MAQYGNQPVEIGDYSVIEQVGYGSFSVVWHAKHRLKGYDVAIKEIPTARLNKKLQESLLSEIAILRKIDHPNITRLHETIEVPGRIYLVLEYCTGGDLSKYIQRHGRVSEVTARDFMHQLADGLRVLREYNLIHRDLKPQNLLLSTSDSNAVLKIADFGFARPLEPQGLADTLCGSPLYMAPEIMQLQKYDAKADLWSVGTILFQLVTGKTPFSGNNQMQLMQNIMKSNEIQFPPEVGELHPYCKDLCNKLLRQHPVERLSFEEFFDHDFLRREKWESSPKLIRPADSLSKESFISGGNPLSDTGGSSLEDLPFPLDDDLHGQVGSSSLFSKENTMTAPNSSGFTSSNAVSGRISSMNSAIGRKMRGYIEVDSKQQVTIPVHKYQKPVNSDLLNALVPDVERGFLNTPLSKELDSFEYIDQEYVFVPATPTEISSSSFNVSGLGKLPAKVASFPMKNIQKSPSISAPMAIDRAAVDFVGSFESPGNQSSIRSGTSPSSSDLVDIMDQPSANPLTRLQSLIRCARAITDLANEKLRAEKQLEAFSTQLVCLAIWKQALHTCYLWASSATGGSSPSSDVIISNEALNNSANIAHTSEELNFQGAAAACSQMEREFLIAVERAEKYAPSDASAEMPDAMEAIFQEALLLGRKGAVDELMGNMKDAASLYSKSASLLYFLLIEATSLELNPRFLLSSSDRHRLHRYIDMLTFRQNQCSAETMALQHPEGLQSV